MGNVKLFSVAYLIENWWCIYNYLKETNITILFLFLIFIKAYMRLFPVPSLTVLLQYMRKRSCCFACLGFWSPFLLCARTYLIWNWAIQCRRGWVRGRKKNQFCSRANVAILKVRTVLWSVYTVTLYWHSVYKFTRVQYNTL